MNFQPKYVIEDDDMDLLRQFCAWIEVVVEHAAIDYDRRQNHRKMEVVTELPVPDRDVVTGDFTVITGGEFEIEEEKLSKEFSKLNLLRRRILTLSFEEGLSAEAIADRLHCQIGYVYKQKSLAIKFLRNRLMGGGEKND